MNMGMSVSVRTMFLNCLRENAANMRREHVDLGNRIAIALEKSRASLVSIEMMNLELRRMKESVHNVITNMRGNIADSDLDVELDFKTVSQKYSEGDLQIDEVVPPALQPVDESNNEVIVESVSSQKSVEVAEPIKVTPLDALENNQKLSETVFNTISHIDLK
ncbi:uncharacterized protein LOC108087457 [Drosophila ficusphila]|uniref:uncharacterized protein LOC108087457 n=1 Tax=Drosophila ficusphila TaxID=30025 RepID=UPI0007E72408|nr:uncharacterized protein LOC108087457 [Drosophila ficusphila]